LVRVREGGVVIHEPEPGAVFPGVELAEEDRAGGIELFDDGRA
jgi:hypothetical protein